MDISFYSLRHLQDRRSRGLGTRVGIKIKKQDSELENFKMAEGGEDFIAEENREEDDLNEEQHDKLVQYQVMISNLKHLSCV